MKYKKTMILLMIAIFIFGAASVCASDANDTIIANEDDSIIELSAESNDNNVNILEENDNDVLKSTNDQTLLTDGETGSLVDLNHEINDNDNTTITLTKNYKYVAGDEAFQFGMDINRTLTINGNGRIIDGSGAASIFKINADHVTITNLTFKNCMAHITWDGYVLPNHAYYDENTGGAIKWYGDYGTITHCTFTENHAHNGGGAILCGGDYITVKLCNFKNNIAEEYGGAISVSGNYGTVTESNFTGNKALEGQGGAIQFNYYSNVSQCIFINNTASYNGGAISMGGSNNVSYCIFIGNKALWTGGAINMWADSIIAHSIFGNNTAEFDGGALSINDPNVLVINSTFAGNSANRGGAIWGYDKDYTKAILSIFDSNINENFDYFTIVPAYLNVNNFTISYNSGEKLLFNLTADNVNYDGYNITIRIYNQTDDLVGTFYALSGDGWIPDLPVGIYKCVLSLDSHPEVEMVNSTITVMIPVGKYYVNVTSVKTNNKTVNITAKTNVPKNISWDAKLLFILPNGTQIDAIYGANGTWWAEHTFDDYGEYNVNATYVGLDNVTVNNGTITINKVNSTIALDNIVLDYGESANVTVTTTGATGITANINGTDVTVINNYTIPISGLGAGNYILTVTTIADDNHNPVTKEVTITVNKVSTEITLANETLDLKVNDEFAVLADLTPAGAGNLTYSSSNESVVKVSDEGLITALSEGTSIVTVSFAGNDNYTVAQNKTINVTVSLNDASVSAEDITLDIGANATIGAVSVPEGLKVTYIPDNSGVVTVENGVVTAVKEGTAKITLKVGGDGIYAENSTTITVTVNKINATVDVLIPENVTVGDNSTVNVVLPDDATGNVTVKVDGEVVDTVPVKDGSADVTIPSMSAGNHTVNVSYSGDDNYKSSSKTATLSVAKDSTNLTAANVTATYNINKYLVITLKDSKGNPLANSTVTVDLNGAKNYTTDENGQVKVKVSNLVPKTYSAKITFDGNGNYLGSDATAKVVVKKATPKITANAKTFKTTTKTKKYTITLKDNTGKAIKNAKVYLKVNGKTYKATTNSKGKATFKITKLDKKGTFKATITYKGSKYYNKVTKKANIKVISTWKTISKGSKLKSTVKEIQRALKNNGYYLTAYGHYLMVDGIYWDHTVNAVKQFQKAKGLKVTGKVDEKTAKKLGII